MTDLIKCADIKDGPTLVEAKASEMGEVKSTESVPYQKKCWVNFVMSTKIVKNRHELNLPSSAHFNMKSKA